MQSGFRIDEQDFRAWHAAVESRATLRGLAAVAAEMGAHLKRASDGHVPVARHQLFSWSETLSGAAVRDPRAASAGNALSLAQVADDMKTILGGGAPPGTPQPATRAAPVPVAYMPTPAPSASGGAEVRFAAGPELPDTVRRFIAGARNELLVIAPWQSGLETIVDDLKALPPTVKVRLVGRQPAQLDSSYHRGMMALGARGAVTTWSPHLYTRMIVRDRNALCLGAAGTMASGESALITTDPTAVAGAVAHFERVVADAPR